MKVCPFCGESIQDEAIKCRYCKEYLNDNNSIITLSNIKKLFIIREISTDNAFHFSTDERIISFSADSSAIAGIGGIWRIEDGVKLNEYSIKAGKYIFSPDNTILVTEFWGEFSIWHFPQIKLLKKINTIQKFITSMDFSPFGKDLIISGKGGYGRCTIRKINILKDFNFTVYRKHNFEYVNSIRYIPGTYFFAVSGDKPEIVSYNEFNSSRSGILNKHFEYPVHLLEFAKNGLLTVAHNNGIIAVYRSGVPVPIMKIENSPKLPNSLSVSSDDAIIFCCYDDRVEIWNIPDGRQISVIKHPSKTIIYSTISPNGKYFATATKDTIYIWGVSN